MQLTVVIPTFNEADNIPIIAGRLHRALLGIPHELLFIDDSSDHTPQVLAHLSAQDHTLHYEHRTNVRGLGSAVARGFELARGDAIIVMDADLQHPPEAIPALLEALNATDVVIASRFVPGGHDGGLGPFRRFVSAVARYMARLMLHKVRPVADPTSGFFAIRSNVVRNVNLTPTSWKILIEVLAKGSWQTVTESPYRFDKRLNGQSKMSLKEIAAYTKHLLQLVAASPDDRRFILFVFTGLTGSVINLLIYTALTATGLNIELSGFVSAVSAMCSNFLINDNVTWRDARTGAPIARFGKFCLASTMGIAVDLLILALLTDIAHLQYLLANVIGIALGAISNYLLNDRWTWKQTQAPAPESGTSD